MWIGKGNETVANAKTANKATASGEPSYGLALQCMHSMVRCFTALGGNFAQSVKLLKVCPQPADRRTMNVCGGQF